MIGGHKHAKRKRHKLRHQSKGHTDTTAFGYGSVMGLSDREKGSSSMGKGTHGTKNSAGW